jgi:predicted transposase/invertase (TIGR01784 family)
VFSAAGIARLDPIEMKAYDESLKVLWDNYSIIKTARKEGYEQGKAERIREIAGKMKSNGYPTAQIARLTGLSIEEIGKLY